MGSALAYWLTRLAPKTSVLVIERDPTYASASSALSAASIRQQFTTPVNIRISQASIEFLRDAPHLLDVDGFRPDIGLKERGYLYLATPAGLQTLQQANALQSRLGASVEWFDTQKLAIRFPWLNTTGLSGGSLGVSGEGWFDGYSLLGALGTKARSQGARYISGEVVRMGVHQDRVNSVELADGSVISSGHVVNAAGPWARSVASMAGVDLPVFGRRRTVYVIACRAQMDPFPLLIDPAGFWIRPEGSGYIAGITPAEDPDDLPLDPDYPAFESVLWPALAQRIPQFEAAKLQRAWAGYYEMNVFDHNGVVGFHPRIGNLLFMNGFSGHGLQQAPVVGRGVAELILQGRFVSVDLSDLAFERLLQGRPLLEQNVI